MVRHLHIYYRHGPGKSRKNGVFSPVSPLIKILKIGTGDMVKRKKYTFRKGDIIDVEEHHDGRYGAPGKGRAKKEKPTKEQVKEVNRRGKTNRCRQRLLMYIGYGDCFATLTYRPEDRPASMKAAVRDFGGMMGRVRREFKKRGREAYWFRNIERGTKGAWHIHLVITETGETASILQRAWTKGGIWCVEIRRSKFYDEDFSRLASYMTKDQYTVGVKSDGSPAKPRIREASYSTSRNMPLPEPKVDRLVRWKKEPKPKKGYYIAGMHEGINPVTGYRYRRYTMIRLNRRE